MHCERIQSTVDHSSREWDFDEKWFDFWQRFDCKWRMSSYDMKKIKSVKMKKRENDVTNSKIFDIVQN